MNPRETCKACWQPNAVGFNVPEEIWRESVPERLQNGVVCIGCFARFADERQVQWDKQIEFFPVSFVTHQKPIE